jgi:formylglycine-generating enzyme required for sulfatase activity
LGFASGVVGDEEVTPLTPPPRLVLAGTALVMLALTAFGVAGYRWWHLESPVLVVNDHFSNHGAFEAQTIKLIEPIGGGKFEVTLGSARHTARATVQEGAEIPVTWSWKEVSNREDLEGSVVLNAGRLAQPIRACRVGWPQRSLAVIAMSFEGEDEEASKAARQLAIRLLDKGSADEVLMGEQWEKALPTWLGESQALNRNTQVLVILPHGTEAEAAAGQLKGHPGPWAVGSSDNFAALAKDIKNNKSQALADVFPKLQVYRHRQAVRVSGGPEKSAPDRNGIEWVHVCPGTFTMGTINKEEDPKAYDNEIVDPPRTVVMSGFDMAATETIDVQGDKKTNMPWVKVDWKTAREFCQQAGRDARDNLRGDLPTEAQWEYAARGGSRFPWSFGDEEGLLEYYANCNYSGRLRVPI